MGGLMQEAVRKSELRFLNKTRAAIVPALSHAQITASSGGLGWKGLYLEVGTNFGCNVDELMVDGHFIGLQLNSESILISTRLRSEEHTSELQSLMRISYAVFCLKKKTPRIYIIYPH